MAENMKTVISAVWITSLYWLAWILAFHFKGDAPVIIVLLIGLHLVVGVCLLIFSIAWSLHFMFSEERNKAVKNV